jgi:3-deoxy-D-manno-octulosonate cytidylyltransferase
MSPHATVVIPARLQSSRLPRKMLADVGGCTLVERTHDVAVRAGCGPVVVLADDEEVAAAVRAFGGDVLLTDPALESGTARAASVLDRLEGDVIVNLQGDAPLTDPAIVVRAAAVVAATTASVALPVYRIQQAADVQDPNIVKVVQAGDGRILYCSRAAVPFVRDHPEDAWPRHADFWGHVGLYAYRRPFLERFAALPASPLEDTERLEQLRWLEAGVELRAFEVAPQGTSVDTPAQLERVRRELAVSNPVARSLRG